MILTQEALKTKVPSIFATEPEAGVSDRYKFMSTENILNQLQDLNYYPVTAKQDQSRTSNPNFSKHMIRFRHEDYVNEKLELDGTVPEIVLINSHNRSFRFQMSMGLYRMVCSNGLVISEAEFMKVNTKHMSFEPEKLQEYVIELVKNSEGVFEKINDYKNINLDRSEKMQFADKTAQMYWGENYSIDPKQLLEPKRYQDEGDSLWNVFNVIQENVSKGGIQYRTNGRFASTRPTKEIRREYLFNQNLWTMMEGIRVAKI